MKIKYLFCLFVILSFVCYLGFSQEITVEQAIELAKENNPDLKKQKLTLEDAKRKAQNKWNKFLPNMSASANLSNSVASEEISSSNCFFRSDLLTISAQRLLTCSLVKSSITMLFCFAIFISDKILSEIIALFVDSLNAVNFSLEPSTFSR